MPNLNLPELKRLDAAATEPPWIDVDSEDCTHPVIETPEFFGVARIMSQGDYDCAVAARNALPQLIAIAEQVAERDKRIAELETDARRYRALKSTAQAMDLRMNKTATWRVPLLHGRFMTFDEACDALVDKIDSAARGD